MVRIIDETNKREAMDKFEGIAALAKKYFPIVAIIVEGSLITFSDKEGKLGVIEVIDNSIYLGQKRGFNLTKQFAEEYKKVYGDVEFYY